jgi:hypothetical protein
VTDLLPFLQVFAAAVLALAAVTKIVARVDLFAFLTSVGMPVRLARVAAHAIVPTEVALATLLAAGVAATGVALTALALSLGFVVVQIKAVRDPGSRGCRCFGHLDVNNKSLALGQAVLLAAALLVASAAALVGEGTASGSEARIYGGLTGVGAVVALALAGQVVRFHQLRPRLATRSTAGG